MPQRTEQAAPAKRSMQVNERRSFSDRVSDKFWELAASSEMVCSLLFEGAAGCPYNRFTKHQVVQFSVLLSLVGVVSLVFGA